MLFFLHFIRTYSGLDLLNVFSWHTFEKIKILIENAGLQKIGEFVYNIFRTEGSSKLGVDIFNSIPSNIIVSKVLTSNFNINNYLKAIEDYTKALEINKMDAASYCGRGASKHMISDYLGAIEDFTKAIEIERQIEGIRDELQEAFFGRSKSKAKIGDFEGSKKDNMISNVYKLRVKI